MNLCWFIFLLVVKFAESTKCIDENGRPVDWIVAYKLPQLKNHPNGRIRDGVGLMVLTSASQESWSLSKFGSNESSSFLGRTLEPLYVKNASQDVFWLLYNDQPPNGPVSFDRGHTKGLVLGDVRTGGPGIWLIHSVPHYPPVPGSAYGYPSSGHVNGQSFLCLSLDANQMDSIGQQLMFNDPNLYASSIPAASRQHFPHLAAVLNNTRIRKPPFYNRLNISTIGGDSFVSFAKSGHFGKDLYSDWVSLTLQSDLDVESWPNGRGKLPSECRRPFQVYNVQQISFSNITQYVKFSSHRDHSKWATSSSYYSGEAWTCIGDINRMAEQKNRGGGTVCRQDVKLHSAFRNIIRQVEPCPKNKLKQNANFHRQSSNYNNVVK